MKCFMLELSKRDGSALLPVNAELIEYIEPLDNGCAIHFSRSCLGVKEDYRTIREMIRQGGGKVICPEALVTLDMLPKEIKDEIASV